MNKFRKAIRKTSTNIQRPPSPPSDPPLSLSLEQISTYERRLFETQWIELNPFDLDLVSLDTLRTFLHQSLPVRLINQLIGLFGPAVNEWDQGQVFALFRLVCHVKEGRKINADLVYLPAPPPRNRSFSDPFVSVPPDNGLHRQRHSVDTSSLLLMESFAPSPSKRHAIHLNLRPNLLHQPAPPVPPQHTKPAQLSHVHGIKSDINIFDTPPHYRRHFNHADQTSFIPSID